MVDMADSQSVGEFLADVTGVGSDDQHKAFSL